MAGLDDVPRSVHRAILAGVVLYFILLVYGNAAGSGLARTAAYLVFGVIAIAIGGSLSAQARRTLEPIGAAGLCLISGGIAQLAWVATILGGRPEPAFDLVATLAVFAGIALYIYAVWIDR